jgi:hypothetical protein
MQKGGKVLQKAVRKLQYEANAAGCNRMQPDEYKATGCNTIQGKQ